MGRYAKLIMVTPDNNNKLYILEEDGDVVKIKRGRIDSYLVDEEPKPISHFDKILNAKLKKGYKNVTDLVAEKTSVSGSINYVDITDRIIKDLIDRLMAYAKKVVDDNYTVKSTSVTQKQIDEAQKILDELSTMIKMDTLSSDLNSKLLNLFTILPRKMNKVQNYLIPFDKITNDNELELTKKLFNDELDKLTAMSGLVLSNTNDDNNTTIENKTILDTLGIKIERVLDSDIKIIKDSLGEIKDKFINAYVVINLKSQKRFDEWVQKSNEKKTKLLWHGSRNQNWVSILQNSLMIRPSGVITTGSMFGSSAIYYASKAKKSYGYTSASGSYWAKGNSNVCYMALFDVHVGKEWDIYRHESYCYDLDEKKVKGKGCDSVFAHAQSGFLYNDEIMVYNPSQCTIKYLVELKG